MTSVAHRSIDDEDESVRIAVRALGDMRSGAPTAHTSSSLQPTPALSATSTATSPILASPTLAPEDIAAAAAIGVDVDSPDFVSRVAHLPIFNTALQAYKQGKASSRVVKYGAEMVESSVMTISRPVIDRLPVNSLDEFACRQLDRLGRYGRRPSSAERMQTDERERSASVERGRSSWESGLQMRDVSMVRSPRDESVVRDQAASPAPAGSRTEGNSTEREENTEQQQQVAQRSRWQAVLLEAGGISAAISEESMRRLKYCLQWLQYATTHIDGQILVLRDFMAALQPPPGSPHALNPEAIITAEHMRQLTNVKRDVVNTVRQVVDIVSKYAGGALPEPARTRVRGFILHLPQAWASAARRENVTTQATPARGRGTRRNARRNGELSRPASPAASSSPRHSRQSSAAASATGSTSGASAAVPPTAGAATQAAQRILTLATESLDMMRGVTGVVKDSLDRADAWVERLRVVGLQRGPDAAEGEAREEESEREQERLPPPLNLMSHRGFSANSTNTSVASSPIMGSVVLPPLRSPATLSPLVYQGPEASYFTEHRTANGNASTHTNGGEREREEPIAPLGRLNLGAVGKKGMFAEDGEIVVAGDQGSEERGVGDGGTRAMDVDG